MEERRKRVWLDQSLIESAKNHKHTKALFFFTYVTHLTLRSLKKNPQLFQLSLLFAFLFALSLKQAYMHLWGTHVTEES